MNCFIVIQIAPKGPGLGEQSVCPSRLIRPGSGSRGHNRREKGHGLFYCSVMELGREDCGVSMRKIQIPCNTYRKWKTQCGMWQGVGW